jgi:lipopolysaccharide/colanic/teichoic acid biosynthesis glycosyltransferase
VLKAAFDKLAAAAGLLALAPALAALAVAIALEDGFPVLFRQTRVGRRGKPFRLVKFRSMRVGAPGTRITAGGDPRVTRVGAWLRRYKIDELPQLWNVLAGDLSLVGPRPEIPPFVDVGDPAWRAVLEVKPGITDPASLRYRREEELLAGAPDPEQTYREQILPAKLALNLEYIRTRTFWGDLKLIGRSVQACAKVDEHTL